MMILIIICIILLCIIIFIINSNTFRASIYNICRSSIYNNFRSSSSKIKFTICNYLTAIETKHFLLLDSDNYIHNFNDADLIARGAFSLNSYIQTIINSASDFTKKEIDYLMDLLREYIKEYLDDVNKNNMKLKVIGDISKLDEDLQNDIKYLS